MKTSSATGIDNQLFHMRGGVPIPSRFLSEKDIIRGFQTGMKTKSAFSEDLFPEDIQYFLESNKIFTNLHSKLQPILHDPSQVRKEVLNTSMEYRAALSQCVDAKYTREESEDQPIEDSSAEVPRLLLAIWHLCEIFLLDHRQVVTPGMLHWIQEHYSKFGAEEIMERREALQQNPQPESSPDFWPTVCEMAALGLILEAQQILQLHSGYVEGVWRNQDLLEAADLLLSQLPTPEDLVTTSQRLAEFSGRWQRWHLQAQALYADEALAEVDAQIVELFGVLAGNDEILAKYTSNWAQLLVAQILFNTPVVKRFDLKHRVEALMQSHPINELFDGVILAIMGDNTGKAVRCCHELGAGLTSISTTAHLTELFVITGALESEILPEHDVDMREQIFIELAHEVEKSGLGWELAARYLDFCPVLGEELIADLLERTVITSERQLRNMVSYCRGRELDELARSLCSTFAVKRLSKGVYGAAAYWFNQAMDEDRLAALCHMLIDKSIRQLTQDTVELEDSKSKAQLLLQQMQNVIEAVGKNAKSFLVPDLSFLNEYYNFTRSLPSFRQRRRTTEMESGEKKEVLEAFKSLCSMAQMKSIAQRFLPYLIQLCVPVLETLHSIPDLLVAPGQIYTLMGALQDVHSSPWHRVHSSDDFDWKFHELTGKINELLSSVLVQAIYSEHANKKPEEQMYSLHKQQQNESKNKDSLFSRSINIEYRSADDLLAPCMPIVN